jgi:hypothetical protein
MTGDFRGTVPWEGWGEIPLPDPITFAEVLETGLKDYREKV